MEVKGVIQAEWDKYDKKFEYKVRPYLCSDAILVEERELSFVSPTEAALRQHLHEILISKKQKVLADANVEANEIQQEADELLALPSPSQEA